MFVFKDRRVSVVAGCTGLKDRCVVVGIDCIAVNVKAG